MNPAVSDPLNVNVATCPTVIVPLGIVADALIEGCCSVTVVDCALVAFPTAPPVIVACPADVIEFGAVYTVLADGPNVDRLPGPVQLQFTLWLAVIIDVWLSCNDVGDALSDTAGCTVTVPSGIQYRSLPL